MRPHPIVLRKPSTTRSLFRSSALLCLFLDLPTLDVYSSVSLILTTSIMLTYLSGSQHTTIVVTLQKRCFGSLADRSRRERTLPSILLKGLCLIFVDFSWPGRLDVTVGGGIIAGETALSTIIRECTEEASLDANFVQENIHSVGFISFPNRSATGWVLPGFYYLFDLLLPSDGSVQPQINAADGEVEGFELMDTQTVLENLLAGAFKPSSALALVDFLIRHGFLTEDTDARFAEVCLSLRQYMPLPVPWRP